MHFVENIILGTCCEFYYDDVTVMLFINIIYRAMLQLKSSRKKQHAVIYFFVGKRT